MTNNSPTISVQHTRSTRADLVATLVMGGIAVFVVLTNLVLRLVDLFDGGAVAVPVLFSSMDIPLPSGEAMVAVDQGVVTASDIPFATAASVFLAAVLPAAATLVVIGCSGRLVLRLLRGHAFEAGTSTTIAVVSFAILGGWIADTLFSTMAANGALAAIGAGDDGHAFTVSWVPFLVSIGLGSLAILLRSGERMRRDTEGLV
jgi:hypothetical protein